QRKIKGCLIPYFTLYPDSATVRFDDSFHGCKTDATAFGFSVYLVEYIKDTILIFHRYTHTIITHKEDVMAGFILSLRADLDDWRSLRTSILDRVFNQILKSLSKPKSVAQHDG